MDRMCEIREADMWTVKQTKTRKFSSSVVFEGQVDATYIDLLTCFGSPEQYKFHNSDGETEEEYSWHLEFSDGEKTLNVIIFSLVFGRLKSSAVRSWGVYGDAGATALVTQFLDGIK